MRGSNPSASIAALVLAFTFLATSAHAQTFPNRPVRILVPFPPGGSPDVTARLIAPALGEALGQPVVVYNRSGASGAVGDAEAAHSDPDGYTLLVSTGDFITAPPEMFPAMSFDPHKAFMPIMRLASVPLILLANANAPFSNVKELVEAAKASPGKFSYSSPGIGTINQIAIEWLALEAGIKLIHVPYREGAVPAIAAGQVQLGITGPSSMWGLLQSGKIRALGVMSKDPAPMIGDIQPVSQQGFPDIDASLFVGMFAPAGTPPAIAEKISTAMNKILQDESLKKRLNEVGLDADPLTGSAFDDYIKSTGGRYAQVVRDAGIKPGP